MLILNPKYFNFVRCFHWKMSISIKKNRFSNRKCPFWSRISVCFSYPSILKIYFVSFSMIACVLRCLRGFWLVKKYKKFETFFEYSCLCKSKLRYEVNTESIIFSRSPVDYLFIITIVNLYCYYMGWIILGW